MEEDALQDAWSLSLANGFKGDKEDFTNLLQSDSNFFDLSFSTFKEKGFEGDKEAYSNLLGVQPTPQEQSVTEGETPQPTKGNKILPVGVASQEQLDTQPKVASLDNKPVQDFELYQKLDATDNPYTKEVTRAIINTQNQARQAYSEQIVPLRKEKYDELSKELIPFVSDKKQKIQSNLDAGEITAEEANTQFQEYVKGVDENIMKQVNNSFDLREKEQKILNPIYAKLEKDAAALNKMEKVSVDMEMDKILKEKRDQIGFWENIGSAFQNEWIKTKMLPTQITQVASQLTEDFETDEPQPMITWGEDGFGIEYKTKQEQQIDNYKALEGMRGELNDTKQIIDSWENGDYSGVASASVGSAINFAGSMARAMLTRGMSMTGEMTEPVWTEAVKAKAEKTGKTEEEIIAEDSEDELTALSIGAFMTLAERTGMKGFKEFAMGKLFKDQIRKEVKRQAPSLAKTVRKEVATELVQGGLEKANTEILKGEEALYSVEGGKVLWEEMKDFVLSKEGAETAISTTIGTILLGKTVSGVGALTKLARGKKYVPEFTEGEISEMIDKQKTLLSDLNKLYVTGAIGEDQYNDSKQLLEELNSVNETLEPNNPQRAKSIKLIAERETEKNRMVSLDETQQEKSKLKIEEINNQLKEIADSNDNKTTVELYGDKQEVKSNQTASETTTEEAPTEEQKFKDISDGKVVTFTYPNKQSIPDILKDRVTSTTDVTEKSGASKTTYRVTISQSEADYLLAQEKVAPTTEINTTEEGSSQAATEYEDLTASELETLSVVDLIQSSTAIDKEEKKILWRQYQRGVMSADEISRYTNVDLDVLKGDKKPSKWEKVLLDKLENQKKSTVGEEIEFEEIESLKESSSVSEANSQEAEKVVEEVTTETDPLKDIESTTEALKGKEKPKLSPIKMVGQLTKNLPDKGGRKGIKTAMGDIGHNYNIGDVEVTLSKDFDFGEIDGEQQQADVSINFIGVSKKESLGEGLASKELDRIIALADIRGMSLSLTVDPQGATLGLREGEKEGFLSYAQLEDWYKKRGFIFDEDSSYGFRPARTKDQISQAYHADKAAGKETELTKAVEELLKQEQDAIQEQAAGKVPVQPEAQVGGKVDEKVQAEPQVTAQEEKVAAAKQKLGDAWAKWKEKQQNTGIIFDPKSKAAEDVELVNALVDYLKEVGVKTIEDVKKAISDFTSGEIELDDNGAKVIFDKTGQFTQEQKNAWNERAMSLGFDNAPQAIASTNKRKGTKYKTLDEISDRQLKDVSKQRAEEKALEDSANKAVEEGKSLVDFQKANKKLNADAVEAAYKTAVNKNLSPQQAKEKLDEVFQKAKDDMKPKDKGAEKRRMSKVAKGLKALTDVQIEIKNLFNAANMKGVSDRIQTLQGAAGAAKFIKDKAYDKIYKGITSKDKTVLDKIIFARRISQIDKDRRARGLGQLRHPDFISQESTDKALKGIKEEIGTEKFNDLNKRADAYFQEFKDLLDRMEQAGLISKETRDNLYELDYQPRKFIQHMVNPEGDFSIDNVSKLRNGTGLSESQIKSLDEGSARSLITDSEWLLATAINQKQKATEKNKLFKKIIGDYNKLKESYKEAKKKVDGMSGVQRVNPMYAKKEKGIIRDYEFLEGAIIDNPIVRYTKSGTPVYKYDNKNGYVNIHYWDKGVHKKFFMRESYYNSLMKIPDNNFERAFDLSQQTKSIIAKGSGATILRPLATGINPLFVVGNTPRDFGFTLMFEPSYSIILPKAIAQVTADAANAYKEIYNQTDTFKDFVMHGGMQDFMYQMGDLTENSTGRKMFKKLASVVTDDKKASETLDFIIDKATKLNEYSELGFRVGIYTRVFNNEMKEIDKQKNLTPQEREEAIEDAKYKAAARARSIMDFNQGGYIIKALDSGMPYLNAATQATYSSVSKTFDSPQSFGRVLALGAQAGGVLSGITVLASLAAFAMSDDDDEEDQGKTAAQKYVKALNGVNDYIREKYFVVFTGGKDVDGNYNYVKIAKTQNLIPLFIVSEHYMNNKVREIAGEPQVGEEELIKAVLKSMSQDVDPLNITDPAALVSRIPTASALITYRTGYDYFKDQNVSYDVGKVDKALEGLGDDRVEDFYKDLSQYGISPARAKASVEKIITSPSTDPYVAGVYGIGNAISTGDLKKLAPELGEAMLDGLKRRVSGTTSKYVESYKIDDRLQKEFEAINRKERMTEIAISKIIKEQTTKEITPKEAIDKLIEEMKKVDPENMDDIIKRYNTRMANKQVPSVYLQLKYERNPKKKALIFIDKFGADALEMKDPEQMKEIIGNFKKINYNLFTPEFFLEVQRLIEKE